MYSITLFGILFISILIAFGIKLKIINLYKIKSFLKIFKKSKKLKNF